VAGLKRPTKELVEKYLREFEPKNSAEEAAIKDPLLVDQIAKVTIHGKVRRNYAFATKYCSFHNPCEYPIYDSFVDRVLRAYQKQDKFSSLPLGDLKDYERFKEVLEAFVLFYDLRAVNARELDCFLWGYGKEIFRKKRAALSSRCFLSPASESVGKKRVVIDMRRHQGRFNNSEGRRFG